MTFSSSVAEIIRVISSAVFVTILHPQRCEAELNCNCIGLWVSL